MISGSFIGLMINGAFVSCETQCQINFNQEMLPASAYDSGGWSEFIYGLRDWDVSVNGNFLLESAPSDIKTLIQTGFINQLPMYCQFRTNPSTEIQLDLSGAVLFNSGSITAAAQGLANWTAKLKGTGKLTADYTDLALLIDAMPSYADYPLIVDETGNFTT